MSTSSDDDEEEERNKSFPFFSLPAELRLRIYEHLLLVPSRIVDLDPVNYRRIVPRIQCFRVSRRMHEEASHVFYGSHVFQLFPQHGRFFNTKKPLLTRMSARSRAALTAVEMRLGPGWSAPPRCQNTSETLGLRDCLMLRTLVIFIEIDPSDDFFNGHRGKNNERDTYQHFALALLRGVIEQVPSLRMVVLDAYPSVGRNAPLVTALASEAKGSGKTLLWGPLRGWDDEQDCGQLGLEQALAGMTL